MAGAMSGDLLTWHGRVLIHGDRDELEYLFTDMRVVDCPREITPEQTMPIAAHPDMAAVRFPLDRRDFRR